MPRRIKHILSEIKISKKMFSYDAIILDMDGLILNSEHRGIEIWQTVNQSLKLGLPDDLWHEFIGLRDKDAEKKLALILDSPSEAYRVQQYFLKTYYDVLEDRPIPPKNGAHALIRHLETHQIPWGIATGTMKQKALIKLKKAELCSTAPHIIGGDEVNEGKPKPEIYLKMANHLGFPPGRCLALEDSAPGLQAALTAGMTTIHIPDLTPVPQTIIEKTHFQFNSLEDFLTALKN